MPATTCQFCGDTVTPEVDLVDHDFNGTEVDRCFRRPARRSRTDVHRPVELVTEDYAFVMTFDNMPPQFSPWTNLEWYVQAVARWREQRDRVLSLLVDSTAPYQNAQQCDHCGARIRYSGILRHMPSGTHVAVGEVCLDNRFSLATGEFQELRRSASLDSERRRVAAQVLAWVEADSTRIGVLGGLLAWQHRNEFLADLLHKTHRYGPLSDRQESAARTAILREVDRASRPAPEPDKTVPAPQGRVQFEGEVVSTKPVETDFGLTLKMLVKCGNAADGYFKVWVTVPASFEYGVSRGDVVRLTATLSRSYDDKSFAFGKRPTGASFVSRVRDQPIEVVQDFDEDRS